MLAFKSVAMIEVRREFDAGYHIRNKSINVLSQRNLEIAHADVYF